MSVGGKEREERFNVYVLYHSPIEVIGQRHSPLANGSFCSPMK